MFISSFSNFKGLILIFIVATAYLMLENNPYEGHDIDLSSLQPFSFHLVEEGVVTALVFWMVGKLLSFVIRGQLAQQLLLKFKLLSPQKLSQLTCTCQNSIYISLYLAIVFYAVRLFMLFSIIIHDFYFI